MNGASYASKTFHGVAAMNGASYASKFFLGVAIMNGASYSNSPSTQMLYKKLTLRPRRISIVAENEYATMTEHRLLEKRVKASGQFGLNEQMTAIESSEILSRISDDIGEVKLGLARLELSIDRRVSSLEGMYSRAVVLSCLFPTVATLISAEPTSIFGQGVRKLLTLGPYRLAVVQLSVIAILLALLLTAKKERRENRFCL